VTFTVYCPNDLIITEVAAPTNPQYVQHGDYREGFVLPTYQTSENNGCPTTNYEVSLSNLGTATNDGVTGTVSIPVTSTIAENRE
jgi:hypothetical protein